MNWDVDALLHQVRSDLDFLINIKNYNKENFMVLFFVKKKKSFLGILKTSISILKGSVILSNKT